MCMANKNSLKVMRCQRRKKIHAIEQFGGKCQVCGYDRCRTALLFHHLYPDEKKFKPTYIIARWSWKRAYVELKKCVLLCANCHGEAHEGKEDILLLLEQFKQVKI